MLECMVLRITDIKWNYGTFKPAQVCRFSQLPVEFVLSMDPNMQTPSWYSQHLIEKFRGPKAIQYTQPLPRHIVMQVGIFGRTSKTDVPFLDSIFHQAKPMDLV